MIPKQGRTCLLGNCPSNNSLLADSRQLRQALVIHVGLHPEKKNSRDQEQRNSIPHANVVGHSGELNCRLEINFQ